MNLHRTRKIPHTASVFAIYIRAISSEQKYPEEMGYYFIFIYVLKWSTLCSFINQLNDSIRV